MLRKKKNIFRLYREYKPINIKDILLPPKLERKYDSVNYSQLKSKTLNKDLTNFTSVIVENFDDKNLINFYNNINTLTIFIDEFDDYLGGYYDTESNEIILKLPNTKACLKHELLHMSSSFYYNGNTYTGFCQQNSKLNIGVGLTEGYTDVLRERYFGKENFGNVYEIEIELAKSLERIIGKDKMEALYLNSNLPGLISELEKYVTASEIINFLAKFDFIYHYGHNNKNASSLEIKFIINAFREIKRFLVKANTIKYKKKNDIKLIDEDEMVKEIYSYFIYEKNDLKKLSIHGKEYDIFPIDKIEKDMGKILSIPNLKLGKRN